MIKNVDRWVKIIKRSIAKNYETFISVHYHNREIFEKLLTDLSLKNYVTFISIH